MVEVARQGSRQAWFRAVIRAVAVADSWGSIPHLHPASPQGEPTDSSWPGAFLKAAQAQAAGLVIPPSAIPPLAIPTEEDITALEPLPTPSSLEARLLVATPELLLNANRHGHRRAVVQGWGQSLGWTAIELVALDDYFQLLCQGLKGQGLESDRPEPLGAVLAPLVAWVRASQGQFWLALAVAQRQGVSSAQLSLVGLLTILAGGPAALSWALCHRYLSREGLGDRWLNYHDQQLAQLADGIYHRWAGVRPGTVPPQGTAYNG